MKDKSQVKAYFVQGDEYGVAVFATCNVVARREGANELDEQFNAVSCRRLPGADKYVKDHEALKRALVEEIGYWQECAHCQAHVSEETTDRVWEGSVVFCNAECQKYHHEWMAKCTKEQEGV